MTDSISHRLSYWQSFLLMGALSCLALLSTGSSLAQTVLPPEALPSTLVDTIDSEDNEEEVAALVDGGSLAQELGATLAGEDTTLETRDLRETTPFSTYRASSQPLALRTPKDPLKQRTKPKSTIQFQIRGGVEYDDNIFISEDDPQDDVVLTVAPTLAVSTGDFRKRRATYLSAAYTATGSAYLDDTTEETLDHLVDVTGQWKRKKLTVPFAARMERDTGTTLDINGRDTSETYQAQLGLEYQFSSKLSAGISGEYSTTDYDRFADFENHLVEAYLNYHPSSKTTLSGVYRYSDSKTDGADSQTYQAALVRAQTRPSGKLSGLVEAGVAFSDLGKGDRTDLIYRLALAYQPNRKQRVTLEAIREPTTSAFTVGSGYIDNGVQLTYEQALGRKTRLVLSGGYQMQDYFAADPGVIATRQDDYYGFSTLLAYDINAHWQAEIYYTYSDNDSNDPRLAFDNQKVGMGLTWTY